VFFASGGQRVNRLIGVFFFGILGWLASYAYFAVWMLDSGGDFFGGWVAAFTGASFGTGLLMDLCAVTAMMIVLAVFDRGRIGPKWSIAVVASLGLSVSISLAIYLYAVWRTEGPMPELPEGAR
jgi:hypothetical protein